MSWLNWLRKKVDTPHPDGDAAQQAVSDLEDDLPDAPEPGSEDASSELAGLDFYSAIGTHQRWKNRLKDIATGQSTESLDPAVVVRCDACALGMWLAAQTDTRIPPHLLDQIRQEHAQFHKLAADIIRLTNQGHSEEALQGLRTDAPYNRTSHRVTKLLGQIYFELSEFHKPGSQP